MKRLLVVLFALMVTVGLSGKDRKVPKDSINGPYVTQKWNDNIFMGFGAGANYMFGDFDTHGKFSDKVSPDFNIFIGKWIVPNIGVRLQANGSYQLKGWGTANGTFAVANQPDPAVADFYRKQFSYIAVHGDVLWNMSNTIGGYREKRFWNIIPYVGFGAVNSFKDNPFKSKSVWNFAAVGGILNNLRLHKVVDLFIDINALASPKGFDGETADKNFLDFKFSVSGGFSFNLPNKGFRRHQDADYTPYIEDIKYLKKDIAKMESENAGLKEDLIRVNDELLAEKAKPAPVAVVNTVVKVEQTEVPPVALFFYQGRSILTSKEKVNLDFYVTYMKKINPDKVYTLTGMADSATGSAAFNKVLSEKRVKYVEDILIKKHHIRPENIKKVIKGSSNDLFNAPELNRIVMIQ